HPSAIIRPPRSFTPIAVATALTVTSAQATSASSIISAEAGQAPVAAGSGMKAGIGVAAPGAHSASDPIHVEHGLGARRGKCGCGLLPVLLLQRRLQRAQFIR